MQLDGGELRVLQVCGADVGGVPEHVLLLAKGLRAEGVESTVLTGSRWLQDRCAEVGVKTVHNDFTRGLNPVADIRAAYAIRRLCREEPFDLIHLHSSKAGLIGRPVAKLLGLPFAFTPNAWSFFVARRAVERKVLVSTENALARLGGLIIAVSEGEHDRALACGLRTRRCRVEVVPNGVVVPRDAPERDAAVDGVVRVGVAARLCRQKGIDVLVDSLVQRRQDLANVQVEIVGSGPDEEMLRAAVAAGGVSEVVTFLGWRDDVKDLMAGWDVFAMPSRWEGLPYALLEAKAAALPTVGTDIGGIAGVIRDQVDGWLVPPDDPARFGSALVEAVTHRERRLQFGRECHRDVLERFSVEQTVARTAQLYRREVATKA